MIYQSLLKSAMIFSAISGLSPLAVNINKHNIKESNLVADIANKYESSTINPLSINFSNIFNDLTNSAFNSNIKKAININWQISRNNASDFFYFYYDSANHGDQSAELYTKAISDASVKVVDYMAVLTIISDIAHYYGDNTSMDQTLRTWAISQDIGMLQIMNLLIQTKQTGINPDSDFGKKVSHWNYINSSVINDAITNNYTNDELLSNYNNLNYDQLTTYNGNLHNYDDFVYDNCRKNLSPGDGYHSYNIDDWFHLGNSNDHNFLKISMSNSFFYVGYTKFLWNEFHSGMTCPPYNFDIQI